MSSPRKPKPKGDDDSSSDDEEETVRAAMPRDEWPSFITDSPNSSTSQLTRSARRLPTGISETSFLSISSGTASSMYEVLPTHEKLSSQEKISQSPLLPSSALPSKRDEAKLEQTNTSNQYGHETSHSSKKHQYTQLPPSELPPENYQQQLEDTKASSQYEQEPLDPPPPPQEMLPEPSTWQRDSDITLRQEMIENIVTLLEQMEEDDKENSESIDKLIEMVKQLELSLYQSASSFEEYGDNSTLKKRLQSLTIEFAERERGEPLSDFESDVLEAPQVNPLSDHAENDSLPVSSSQQQQHSDNIDALSLLSVEDAWQSWAFAMFKVQALVYFVLMICIIVVDWIDNKNAKIALFATIGAGWLYFIRLEAIKIWRSKSLVQYFYNFWNTWQILTLILILLAVISGILDIVSLIPTPPEFSGSVQFFVLINFLHYWRGAENIVWILYALQQLGKRIIPFVLVLLWILIAASLQLTKIDNTFESKRIIPVFAETYLVAVFGSFETFYDDDGLYYTDLVSALFMFLSLVFMIFLYAMIAFISEDYVHILDQKTSILAWEKACIILEMYYVMGKVNREAKEEQYKVVYKVYEELALTKLGSNGLERDSQGKRSTKNDILKVESRLRNENTDMRREVSEIRQENSEMRKENAEMNKKLSEMTEMLSKLVTNLT